MMPIVRTRLERNAEYHEAIVESYKKLLEKKEQPADDGGEAAHENPPRSRRAQDQPQPEQKEDPKTKEYNAIMEMHADAAKQIRDVLNNEVIVPPIQQAVADRLVMRDRGPVARTLN